MKARCMVFHGAEWSETIERPRPFRSLENRQLDLGHRDERRNVSCGSNAKSAFII
jgi:hypothetical protein